MTCHSRGPSRGRWLTATLTNWRAAFVRPRRAREVHFPDESRRICFSWFGRLACLIGCRTSAQPLRMPADTPEHARWFLEQVLPHEAALRAWLQGRFGAQLEVDDLIQEAYLRLLRAHAEGTVISPKAFLYHAARNLALNQLRHRTYTHPSGSAETDISSVVDSGTGVPEAVARAEDVRLLISAIQTLPDQCRKIFTLRKIYGLSQKEIADRLGLSEHTVEVQGAIGIRKCATYFGRHGDTARQL